MRFVFDGPGAPQAATWYVDGHEYKYGDELPQRLLEDADTAADKARENLPTIRLEIEELAAELAALPPEKVSDGLVALRDARQRARLAEVAIESAAYLRNTLIDNPDSLVRRDVLRVISDEPQPTKQKKAKPQADTPPGEE